MRGSRAALLLLAVAGMLWDEPPGEGRDEGEDLGAGDHGHPTGIRVLPHSGLGLDLTHGLQISFPPGEG